MLSHIRITKSLSKFKQGDYDVLIKRANVFNLKSNIANLANHIFLDPPYDDDIDYFGFSEFWGCWHKMNFDRKDEWKSSELKSEGLDKLLRHIRKITKAKTKVILAFAPKNSDGWNEERCINNNKYKPISNGYFFYDNSHKRDFKRAVDNKHFGRFSILDKANSNQRNKNLKQNLFTNKDILPYVRLAAFVFQVTKPEILRERTAHLAPQRLQGALKKTSQTEFKKVLAQKELNKKAYFTFCYIAISRILKKDKWQITYKDVKRLSLKSFPLTILPKSYSLKHQKSLPKTIFAAEKGGRKIYFSFYEEGKTRLQKIAKTIKNIDKDKCKYICVMIVKDREIMNRLRNPDNDDIWPRGFFTTFDEIRVKIDEVEVAKGNELFARTQKSDIQKEKRSNNISLFNATVEQNIHVGEEDSPYYKLRFKAQELAHIIPGQFVMIDTSIKQIKPCNTKPISFNKIRNKIDIEPKAFLKRPFGIHRTFYKEFGSEYIVNLSLPPIMATILHTVRPNKFDILYKVVKNGLGTKELTRLKHNDKIQMIGPLGKRFNLRKLREEGVDEIHVIGGGVGMAPLIFMVQALRFYSFKIKAFIGIEKLENLKYNKDVEVGYATNVKDLKVFVNDLISAGVEKKDIFVSADKVPQDKEILSSLNPSNFSHGLVTKQYENYLKKHKKKNYDNVCAFSCGPESMLRNITTISKNYSIPLKVLIEKRMACGTGVCLSCVCKTKKNNKEYMSRVCVDGPIFDAKEMPW